MYDKDSREERTGNDAEQTSLRDQPRLPQVDGASDFDLWSSQTEKKRDQLVPQVDGPADEIDDSAPGDEDNRHLNPPEPLNNPLDSGLSLEEAQNASQSSLSRDHELSVQLSIGAPPLAVHPLGGKKRRRRAAAAGVPIKSPSQARSDTSGRFAALPVKASLSNQTDAEQQSGENLMPPRLGEGGGLPFAMP